MIDELVDIDEEMLKALELLRRQKKRIEKAYNKKGKIKTFLIIDLVWKVILNGSNRYNAGKMVPILGRAFPNYPSFFE